MLITGGVRRPNRHGEFKRADGEVAALSPESQRQVATPVTGLKLPFMVFFFAALRLLPIVGAELSTANLPHRYAL